MAPGQEAIDQLFATYEELRVKRIIENLQNDTVYVSVKEHCDGYGGPRWKQEGVGSGEFFRDDVLVPILNDRLKIYIDIDVPCTSSFLKEVFEGLVKQYGVHIVDQVIIDSFVVTRKEKAEKYFKDAILDEQLREEDILYFQKNLARAFNLKQEHIGGYRDIAVTLMEQSDTSHTCKGPKWYNSEAWFKIEWTCKKCNKKWDRENSIFGSYSSVWWQREPLVISDLVFNDNSHNHRFYRFLYCYRMYMLWLFKQKISKTRRV